MQGEGVERSSRDSNEYRILEQIPYDESNHKALHTYKKVISTGFLQLIIMDVLVQGLFIK